MTRFDILKIATYVVIGCSFLTSATLGPILSPWHVAPATVTDIAAKIASISAVALLVTLIVNAVKNPSPPAGTVSAVIPPGSIPVVSAAPGGGIETVALAATGSVSSVTPATQRPPQVLVAAPKPLKVTP